MATPADYGSSFGICLAVVLMLQCADRSYHYEHALPIHDIFIDIVISAIWSAGSVAWRSRYPQPRQ